MQDSNRDEKGRGIRSAESKTATETKKRETFFFVTLHKFKPLVYVFTVST